ncbi:hypothetical protein GCM10009530_60280 [Microbispora corallina]|uniref:NfeD-like C-terminal domain-containing protein n=1 Tax=Microbispora corallina TaxID=83302 RepID=A0ABQ4FYY2_9ACTN|nr:hypothetical protein [Microbispora corallina]GIH40014.1 hypothetical protein Mco01_30140 [Microbispora corallina]
MFDPVTAGAIGAGLILAVSYGKAHAQSFVFRSRTRFLEAAAQLPPGTEIHLEEAGSVCHVRVPNRPEVRAAQEGASAV